MTSSVNVPGAEPVGLDYSIAPGQTCGLRSSLGDLLSGLPAAPLRCGFPEERWKHDPDALLGSDGEREVVECHAEPVVAGDFGGNVVVAAAQVLHEGMTGGEDPR